MQTQPEPAVRLELSAPAEPLTRMLAADGAMPARLYVDVHGATLGPKVQRQIAGAGPVLRIRTAQFGPDTVRVVVELARPIAFAAGANGSSVTIVLGGGGVPAGAAKTTPKDGPPTLSPASTAVADHSPAAFATADAAPALVTVAGVPFVWPALEASEYRDPAAAGHCHLVAGWQRGAAPAGNPGNGTSAASRYLAADLAFLNAAHGRDDYFAAVAAYSRALHEDPGFPDAARAQLMLGLANLTLSLAPEAGAAFTVFEKHHPQSVLLPYARLGLATSLRLRRRPAQAKNILDGLLAHASAGVVCRARREAAALAHAADTPAVTAAAYRTLEERCPDQLDEPGVLADAAEAYLAAGDRQGVDRLLGHPREGRLDAERARLHMLGGMLQVEVGNGYRARQEFERVVALQPGLPLATEARMRLALLYGDENPERVTAALIALAAEPAPAALRAAMLGAAAEVHVKGGRFAEALAVLDRVSGLGPAGQAQAAPRRRELYGRWIATLHARDDLAGLVTLYAARATDIATVAELPDRLAVADALTRLGLPASAVTLLESAAQHSTDAALALVEATLATGDAERALAQARRLRSGKEKLAPALSARLERAAARAALGAGDLETAATEAERVDDPELRAQVAAAVLSLPGGPARAQALLAPVLAADTPPVRALLVAGGAAAAAAEWDAAATAYGRALAHASGAERIEAGAGLARAARARGDGAQAEMALAALATTKEALPKRVAAVVGAPQ